MNIKRAKESFTFWDKDGVPRDIPAGTLIDPDRVEGYKGREHLFEDVEVYVDRVEKAKEASTKPNKPGAPDEQVETATAEPGERRNVTTTQKRFNPPGKSSK